MEARDANRWSRVDEVLDRVLARDPVEWDSVLEVHCAGDTALRTEVERLLARFDQAGKFLAEPPGEVATAFLADVEESGPAWEGRRIGAYRIARQIGRGGMARVFLAERADGQFAQQVALKLTYPGVDSDLDRARFRTERQILAALSHPSIARLLDGGVTEDGQPYFVLELVDGVPIDRYCDDRALSLRDRIQLFLTVLEATQYAHHNLIVHRDLKPSNILVAPDGRVKLLDFGIAKLLEPIAGSGEPPATRPGTLLMTPEFAAPEQVRSGPVSTATDVYALGVLLYMLFTGRRPYDLQGLSPAESERVICEEEPSRPSSTFDRVGHDEDLTTRARLRGATPERLKKRLRGDLDAIVLRALRKEPAQRYGSAEQLARDLTRYLEGRPVLAHRGSRRYRIGKLIRRRRLEFLAGTAIVVSLLAGASVSLGQARRASVERDRAELAARRSKAASDESAGVTSFLLGLFEARDPTEGRGDTLTAWDLLRRGIRRADQLQGQPLAQARMLEVTAQAVLMLGRYGDARDLLQRAINVRKEAHADEGADMARALSQLSNAFLRLGRYPDADSTARQALDIQQRALGPNDPSVAITLHQIGSVAVYRGDLETAEDYHRRGHRVRERALGRTDSLSALSQLLIASTLHRQGKLDAAEREFRAALAVFENSVPRHDEGVAEALMHLGYLLENHATRSREADTLFYRALEIRKRLFGGGHPVVASTLGDLADFHARHGDWATAESLLRERLEMVRRAFGPEHPALITVLGMTAITLHRMKKLDAAEEFYREALTLELRIRGPRHPNVAGHERGLAQVLIDRGDFAGAEPLLREALQRTESAHGPNHPNTATTTGMLGMLRTRQGDYATADSLLRHAVRIIERQVGRGHADVRQLYGWLADLYEARGLAAEAESYRAVARAR
jgi:serine/threonine-protein kinase